MLWKKLFHNKALTWLTISLTVCGMSIMTLSNTVSAAPWNPNNDTAPGYNKCIEQAVSDFDMNDCNWQVIEALEKQIANSYKKINALCNKLTDDDATPDEIEKGINVKNKCLQTVKDEQAAWQKFYKLAQEYSPNFLASDARGGTSDRVMISSALLQMVRDHYDTITPNNQ